MTAWKIRFTNDHGTRVVYSGLPTREQAVEVAKVVEQVAMGRRINDRRITVVTARVAPWDPDRPDPDSGGAVSLEDAILWALGKGAP